MRYYEINREELEQILDFIETGNTDILSTDIPAKFVSVFGAFEAKLSKETQRLAKENARLKTSVKCLKADKEYKAHNGEFAETDLDGVIVAKALLYQLQQVKTYKLTTEKLFLILYRMYASWLYSKNERLFDEHPVCFKSGPWFWRICKRINIREKMTSSDWKVLCDANPAKAKFVENSARKYYDYSEQELAKPIKDSKPILNSMPDRNNGKWNKEITDSDIYLWKEEEPK